MKASIQLLSISLLITLLASCTQPKQFQYNEGYIFGTVYHFTYEHSEDIQPELVAELRKIDHALSMFNANSILSQINQHDTSAFDLAPTPWVYRVILRSLELSKSTQGAFDITVAPLVNAWGFGYEKAADIQTEYLDSIRSFVGYKKLLLQDRILYKKDARIQLDASAIAKGYACDLIAEHLRSKGCNNFLVEIGGELVMQGHNPKKSNWRVGINKPVDDSSSTNMEWEEKLELTDKAMATSGNYRRFYIRDGKRYAHTIDPRTGYPVRHSLLSATVLASDCLTADALATAFMVMGLEEAIQYTEAHPEIESLLIYSLDETQHAIYASKGIAALQASKE
ncbi:MAG: FAD:protein FMN transferase [Bacteroidales bacterium]|nr:FAD:protein FMN transferase [Bacteroidales bacterium]